MADTQTLYKLIVLKMLDQADAPLSNSQISEFILGKEYTNYFTLQQILSELDESGLVTVSSMRNTSLYRITDPGRDTLEYFGDKISGAICQEIRSYLKEKEVRSAILSPPLQIIFPAPTAAIWPDARCGNRILL